jgi:hypothetical protein
MLDKLLSSPSLAAYKALRGQPRACVSIIFRPKANPQHLRYRSLAELTEAFLSGKPPETEVRLLMHTR